MDEGLIHRIMTFAINYDLGIENTFRMIDIFSGCMSNVKSIYMKVPVIECYKSIKGRDRHEVEMDNFDDEKLLKFLNDYELYSDAIVKKYGHPIITRDKYEELKH